MLSRAFAVEPVAERPRRVDNLAFRPRVQRTIQHRRLAPSRSGAGGYADNRLDSSIIAARTLQRLEADTRRIESGLPNGHSLARYGTLLLPRILSDSGCSADRTPHESHCGEKTWGCSICKRTKGGGELPPWQSSCSTAKGLEETTFGCFLS